MVNIRTDLALEAKEIYEKENKKEIPGVKADEYMEDNIKVTNVQVLDEEGEKAMGKPKGTYITMDIPWINEYDEESMDDIAKAFAKTLSPLININESMTAMVVGLGNWNITPDALGPKVVEKLMVTRHLKQLIPDQIDEGIRPVCAMAPGVLGITGIETGEMIKAVVNKVKPNLIICIDALASRSLGRINKTIQIGNTGISPGAGVGNKRMEISEKTLGIPVIAIGVPTVVDAATIANDTIDIVVDEMMNNATKGGRLYEMLASLDKNERKHMIKDVLNPYVGNLMVTPKDVDSIISCISRIISTGINIALQPALELKEINQYIN